MWEAGKSSKRAETRGHGCAVLCRPFLRLPHLLYIVFVSAALPDGMACRSQSEHARALSKFAVQFGLEETEAWGMAE